ncbi:hypothetical protein T4C_11634 [Trichinella pseudospiralis]|uniref:Uncharacterized protein n=1 Tax=Trichinella pseudospiralis TaxID=6337 RepID=A0A0V1ICU7_TRIPS|nr:hypothetical protein T4C_11634 [Trichinella pseudospiralis]
MALAMPWILHSCCCITPMDGANKAISSAKASAVICCPNTLTAVFSASFGKTGKTDRSSSSRNKANKIPPHGSPWRTPTDQRAVTWVPMHLSLQGNQPVFLRQVRHSAGDDCTHSPL